jgi:hypothetical protein
MQRSIMKVGLIGIVMGAGLGLFSAIPLLGCLALPLSLVLYVVVGIFAALQLPAPRQTGPGAGAGAAAGALASLGYGVVSMIVTPLMFMLMGGTEAAIQSLSPQLMDVYRQ